MFLLTSSLLKRFGILLYIEWHKSRYTDANLFKVTRNKKLCEVPSLGCSQVLESVYNTSANFLTDVFKSIKFWICIVIYPFIQLFPAVKFILE